MATQKKPADSTDSASTSQIEAFEAALKKFASAVQLLNKGDYTTAKQQFEALESELHDEPQLAERSRTYARICSHRMRPPLAEPASNEDRYTRAVMLNNSGDADGAIKLLDKALMEEPGSPKLLYVRATAWAIKGSAEPAVSDLRQAIVLDPKIRFQAINDSDFENIREEPSFIDVIEPTPAGA